jgi:DNA-binding beta-propeller fold protein YncE
MRQSILLLSLVAAPSLAAQSYEITHTYNVGGDGGWDYVVPDAPNHRVFIGRQNRVMVVDMNSGRLIAEVTGINGAHGTAVAPATGHGFATSGNDSSIVMFDLKTYKTAMPTQRLSSMHTWERMSPTFRSAASPSTGSRRGTERSTRISSTAARSWR